MKTTTIYFSKNDLFCLQAGYGIAILKNIMGNKVQSYFVDNNNLKVSTSKIIEEAPDLIVIFVSFHSYNLLSSFCKIIKKHLPQTQLCICHNVASGLAFQILTNIRTIDFAILGEFELTLKEICNKLKNHESYLMCSGIAYINSSGTYIVNEPRNLLSNIEEFPYTDRETFEHQTRLFPILGSRGCERNCSFCDRNYLFKMGQEKRPRFRSIDDITNEIDYLVNKYNCKALNFYDSTFGSNDNIEQRLDELYYNLRKKEYWVQFSLCLRVEQISNNLVFKLKKLKTVGLEEVFLGIESFNSEDLHFYSKPTSIDQNEYAIRILKMVNDNKQDYLLKIGYGFINFNPYTTIDSLKDNLLMLQQTHIPIDFYIISTKVSLNYLTPITEKINTNKVFTKQISNFSLEELMERRFNYDFLVPHINDIYNLIQLCKKRIGYKSINGMEYIRNRYLHFFEYDKILKKYDDAYEKYTEGLTKITLSIFNYILDSKGCQKEQALSLCDTFKAEYEYLYSNYVTSRYRMAIKLKKINELIYNSI